MATKDKLALLAVVTMIGGGLAAAQPKPPAKPVKVEIAPPPPAIDTAKLAEQLVGKTANVKEGDVVEIIGSPADMALMEDVAVAVRVRGAFPLLRVNSDSLAKKMIATVPATWDAQVSTLEMGLAKLVKVMIIIPPVRDPNLEDALPPERRAALAKADMPANELRLKRGVRMVELGNGFFPTPARAKLLGLGEAELTKIFWDGVSADYTAVEAKAKALKTQLAAGGVVRITHPNGTDLTLKVKGRKVLTSDGIISDADIKAGGANATVWLPAGEVFVAPVPGSIEGKIVDDRMVHEGKELTGVTVEVKKGKITSITATAGWDAVKGRYDVAGPGKNEIGVLDLGINPAIKTSGKLESWVGAGMVSIGAGNNLWAGGTNKEPFGLVFQLPGTTVTLDGKVMVKDGALQ